MEYATSPSSDLEVPAMGRLASVYETFMQNLDRLEEVTSPVRCRYDGPEVKVPQEAGDTDLARLILELEKCNNRFRLVIAEIRL